jgi:hypothetical protein
VGCKRRGIAGGYERIFLLPFHQAFIARQWIKDAIEQLEKQKVENEQTH